MGNRAARLVVVVSAAVLLLAAGVQLAAQQPQVRLWAVSDGVRVEPTSGRLIEDRTDIHSDYPTGDYRGQQPGLGLRRPRPLRCGRRATSSSPSS